MGQNLKFKRFFIEFTRPADTTAYTAQDSVNNSTTAATILTLAERPDPTKTYNQSGLTIGGSYQIKSLKLAKSTSNTTNASFDLYMYTSGITSGTINNDNSAAGLLYQDKIYLIGKPAFTLATTTAAESDSAFQVITDVNHSFVAVASTFYTSLVATAAYTPGNAEKFYIEAILVRLDE